MISYVKKLRDLFSKKSGYSTVEDPLTSRHYKMDNPYDLTAAHNIIEGAIKEELDQMRPDEKLVVIIGEDHANPAHILIENQLLVSQKSLNPLFSVEQPADYPKDYFINEDTVCYSPVARDINHTFARNANIERVAGDVHQLNAGTHNVIAPDDPVACAIAKESHSLDLNALERNIHANSKGGFDIRNQSMVKRAIDKHSTMDSSLIIQQCGFFHLYGNSKKGDTYVSSLANRFEEAGYRTLGVHFPDGIGMTKEFTSTSAWKNNPNAIIIEGISNLKFDHVSHVDQHRRNNPELIKMEAQFINKYLL